MASEDKKKARVEQIHVTAFRKQCEQACQKEIDGRVVLLVATGADVEIRATVTTTRLYQNLTADTTVVGFYDVKNARLCSIFEGQSLTHREPALDEGDFERYVKSFSPLMRLGRDVLWVLGGRTDKNNGKLRHILTKNGFTIQLLHLCYNVKQMMQYGLFKKQRGVANSRSHELLFLRYKGRLPKQLAKTRVHVDAGSLVFNEVVRNVPVLAQKSHALVSLSLIHI